jgi:phosphoribosylanthranilate isomerase
MTRVKVCGVTNTEDALSAAEAGADLLGFIFYPPSPRSVTPEQARQIIETVRVSVSPCLPVSFVGVFVDEEPSTVQQIVARCGLDYAQLHGAESPEMVRALMSEGIEVIKGFRVRNGGSLAEIERYRATVYLLDAYVPGQPGGTGQTFDWELAVQAKEYGPILLAGGLIPENVAEAVRVVRPWGVDVASGVEATPGRKDHDKVRRFIIAAKSSK